MAALTPQDWALVSRYARGMSVEEVAAEVGQSASQVFDRLSHLHAVNRARSAELLRLHDQATVTRIKTAPPTPVQVGRSFSGAGARPAAAAVLAKPDQEIPDVTTPAVSTLDQLLRDGEAIASPAALKLVGRIRVDCEQLAGLVEHHRAAEQTRNTIARLEAQLATERKKLKDFKSARPASPAPAAKVPAGEVDDATVRAWAMGNGIDCRPSGRVPYDVRRAYAGANGGQP